MYEKKTLSMIHNKNINSKKYNKKIEITKGVFICIDWVPKFSTISYR